MPSSASCVVVGEARGFSPGGYAEVGEGATSFRRLFELEVKLGVFQGNAEVLGRVCCGNSSDGVVGSDPANDTDGNEYLRFGWMSWSQPEEGRRTAGYAPGA